MIHVAVLGAGRMGQTHLRNLAAMPDVHVRVVADPDARAAERGRQLARAERAMTDVEAAIHAPDVDAVVIVTPTATHAHLIEIAARAGKAIWCEKPIALTLAETQHVVRVLEQTRAPFQIGFMRRFDPGYAAARQRIAAGALGRIESFRALSRDTHPPSPKFLASSGGLFLDMAIHDFDLARFLVGEVTEVQAWGAVLVDEHFREVGDIDTAVTLLRFENGALGVVETGRRAPWGYDIRTEVTGERGKIVIEAAQKTPLLFLRSFGFEGDRFESFPDRFEDAYRLELEAFIAALQEGRAPEPGAEEALQTMRLALAADRSWREGRSVKLSEIA
ncbi:MAG: inositol 2-dehydrogenase [Anaerolineae bacterium]|nr:inositol 2-dehydrogenase [Anaerolineae bacterium]